MAKVLIRLILHNKSYNSKACQHSPAARDLRRAATVVLGRSPALQRTHDLLSKSCVRCSARFEKYSWLEVSSGKVALSSPAHKRLDEAVLAAYGWKPDLSDEEILEKLLALNLERSRGESSIGARMTCPSNLLSDEVNAPIRATRLDERDRLGDLQVADGVNSITMDLSEF